MHRMFVYGTLKDDEQVRAITGRTFPKKPAYLRGFRLIQDDGPFPYIVPSDHDMVSGFLLNDVDDGSLQRIDQYEGSDYCRVSVPVQSDSGETQALVYIRFDRRRPILAASD